MSYIFSETVSPGRRRILMDIARMVAHAVGDAVRRSELEQTRAGQRVLADQLAGLAIGLQENGAAPRSAVASVASR